VGKKQQKQTNKQKKNFSSPSTGAKDRGPGSILGNVANKNIYRLTDQVY